MSNVSSFGRSAFIVMIKFYIKKDSLYFGIFLKVVYNKFEGIKVLMINLRKLKIIPY